MSVSERDQKPILRAGFEGSGSPRWLMRTMQTAGFDRAHGFALDLLLLAEGGHRHGTLQALADGRADVVDADRQALAAAHADGLPLVAVAPYGRILGSVVVRRDYRGKGIHGLATLRGGRLGVLSMVDKNWRLLSSACRELAGFDLASAVTAVHYASRSELVAALDAGAIDAALVHWHLVPQLAAAGHPVLAELPDLADALALALGDATAKATADASTNASTGVSANPRAEETSQPSAAPAGAAPTTFFVVHRDLARSRPTLVAAFVAATTDAVGRLREDAQAWQTLADEQALDATHLDALRERWHGRVGAFHPTPMSRSTPCNPF